MVRSGSGHLAFVTSIAAMLGVAEESEYAAVKAGLHMYAASLRTEIAARGVGVTTVVPGVVDTEFFVRRGAPYARRFPRPIAEDRVAQRLLDAVERNRAEVIVPRWLRVPVMLRAFAPNAYARMASRWGGGS